MTDPAQPLKDFKPKKKFFVGIDSDGCAFDTMGIKQRECFCPWLIGYFGLQPAAKAVRECKEFADLFSKTRGFNRHKTTKRIIAELLPAHPMVKSRGFKVPQYPHYFEWVDDPNSLLSNDGLKQLPGNLGLGLESQLFRDTTTPSPFRIGITEPHFRHVQTMAYQGVAPRTRVADKHAYLAIGHFAQSATPLPFDTYRGLALLGEPAVIHDQHPFRLPQGFLDQPLVLLEDGSILPATRAKELLHSSHVPACHSLSHRLNCFARHLQKQPFQILARPVPLLRSTKQATEAFMIQSQFAQQPLNIPRGQIHLRRRGLDFRHHARLSQYVAYVFLLSR